MSEENKTEGVDAELNTQIKRAIEAILMVADTPVEPAILSQLLEFSQSKVEEMCVELVQEYIEQNRGFVLTRVSGGYRFQSHQDQEEYVVKFAQSSSSARLSAAALETLAIVAYKQPISRAQVAEIRGVNVDAVMRTLTLRGLIAELPKSPERAVMFGTTSEFLERLGINSIEDLPSLSEFIPSIEVAQALEAELRTAAKLNSTSLPKAEDIHEDIQEEGFELEDEAAELNGTSNKV